MAQAAGLNQTAISGIWRAFGSVAQPVIGEPWQPVQ
jgi:hypothetical protein